MNEIYEDYIKYLALKIKPTTLNGVKYKFNNYILPTFGKYTPNEITKEMYINFQSNLRSLNYSDRFSKEIHSMCRNLYKYFKLFYDIEDVTAGVDLVSYNHVYTSNQKKGTYTKKEFKTFIKHVDDPIYHALFTVLFFCGLRKGEALALKISDFKDNTLTINKTITKEVFNGKRLILTPKTKKSNRIIELDLFTSLELKRLIKYYSNNFENYNTNFFLFGGNKPISCTSLERKKNMWCKKAHVKQIRIHDFRHSHATMLYNSKVKAKVIQERLGHASISTTLETYVHGNKSQEKKLINKINLSRLF